MPEGTIPPPAGPAITASALAAGWWPAVIGAAGTVLALAILAEGMAFLLYAAGEEPRPSLVNTARFGGFVFYAFHHVGLRVEGSAFGQFGGRLTLAVALLTGTLLGLWLLAVTGRAVANRAGGSTLVRGFHGAKVAMPYAVLCLGLALAVRLPENQGSSTFPAAHPSYLAAALWPLALGVLAGFVGGFRSAPRTGAMATGWGTRIRAAAGGGAWMLAVGLVLSFVGLVLLTPVAPDVAREYFRPFDESFLQGISVIAATLLVVPNMAAWVLFPAMGSCLEVSGSFFGFSGSFCFLSYSQFPSVRGIAEGTLAAPNLPSPPAGYFLFLLAPLIAVLVGGAIAARRAAAASKQEAAAMGALAGVAFALFSLLVIVLSTMTARASGLGQQFPGTLSARVGPALASAFLLSLLWGVVGGTIGGLWEGRRLPLVPPARLAVPAREDAWAAGPSGT